MKKQRKTITLPNFAPGYSTDKSVDYTELLNSLKAHVNTMPIFVNSLKKADNDGWQALVDDLTDYIQKTPKLRKYVRENEKNGIKGISIGEPNIFAEIAAAFVVGYAIGTACYKLGPCNFVT